MAFKSVLALVKISSCFILTIISDNLRRSQDRRQRDENVKYITAHYRAIMSEREQRILHELVKSREAIRRKALMLKRGRDETERTVTEKFKPIIKPLNKLVTLEEENSQPVNKKKKLLQQTVKSEQNLKAEDSDDESQNDQTLKLENIKEESSISEEESDAMTEDKNYEDAAASITDGEDEMTRDYLSLVKMQSNELDKLYGVRQENDQYHLGKSPISIDGDKVYIGDEPYIKSKGLLELLFKKNPDPKHITNTDMKTYKEILDSTNVHRKGFAYDGDLRKCNSKKFENIIEPIFKTGSGLLPRYKVVKRGYGLLPRYKVAKSRDSLKDFVYWNDPNELVDRLRLLVAEKSAGNNAHDNEITSIIEELREDGDYNERKHRTIGMPPAQVTRKNEKDILKTRFAQRVGSMSRKFKIGDKVRVSKAKHLFEKGYEPNWTTEVFTVRRVAPTDPVTYHLQDYLEQPISGCFYEEELSKAKHSDVYPRGESHQETWGSGLCLNG
ncbi:unnamed protein product [Trichogramma brassicae]|uniref:DUF8207 domain-containing protein n=1 Tax=Trichogramma brassicae TaxID=86971 RepID=A0A6H5J166_9HYME|nr:unnamed protein product [Trichogramma brassicae]